MRQREQLDGKRISIHALLAESDVGGRVFFGTPGHISIHALLAESDPQHRYYNFGRVSNFYPRSPCGERRNGGSDLRRLSEISIHALLAESDLCRILFRR